MLDCFKRKIEYLRISVTDRCNLCCTYCMPAERVEFIPHNEIMSFEEIYRITLKAVELGITKVRLTGGEPLVRRNILTLVGMLAGIAGIRDYAMTTNGMLLKEYARPLKNAGLHRLNISLDTIDPARYSSITRGGDLNLVLEGIQAAREAGFEKIKLNCVVRESSDEEDANAVAMFGAENNCEVRFVRCMDMCNGTFWRVEGGDGGDCKRCNRLRLSSDGRIYPCLFSDINYSVRELGTERAVRLALQNKPESGYGHISERNRFYALGG